MLFRSNEKYLLIFFILLGVFYRFYNTNFEDYWLDEFFGFWISDPELNFSETYDRSFGPGWGQNILFDFILKYFYLIFGYYPENGRIFTATISSISIPLIAFLSYQIVQYMKVSLDLTNYFYTQLNNLKVSHTPQLEFV